MPLHLDESASNKKAGRFVHNSLKDGKVRSMAVAYVTHDLTKLLPKKKPAHPMKLICDFRSGFCDPHVLLKLQNAGIAEIFGVPQLHAKVIVGDDFVGSGSVNLSKAAMIKGNIESIHVSHDQKDIKNAAKWINDLADQGEPFTAVSMNEAAFDALVAAFKASRQALGNSGGKLSLLDALLDPNFDMTPYVGCLHDNSAALPKKVVASAAEEAGHKLFPNADWYHEDWNASRAKGYDRDLPDLYLIPMAIEEKKKTKTIVKFLYLAGSYEIYAYNLKVDDNLVTVSRILPSLPGAPSITGKEAKELCKRLTTGLKNRPLTSDEAWKNGGFLPISTLRELLGVGTSSKAKKGA